MITSLQSEPVDSPSRPGVFCEDQRRASELGARRAFTTAQVGNLQVWSFGLASAQSLAEAYSQCGGADAVEQFCATLSGDTSFVLYDEDQRRVIAARDFFGVYPLYYVSRLPDASSPYSAIFSFSIRALIDAKNVVPEVNSEKVLEYLDWRKRDEAVNNQTFYQHIFRLLPGHLYCAEHGHVAIKPYRKLNLDAHASLSDDEYVSRFREIFLRATQKNVLPVTEVAVTLSGGLDSSVVCGVSQSLKDTPVHSFYIDPEVKDAQEVNYAQAVQARWHTRHHVFKPEADVYGSMLEVMEETAEPEKGVLPLSFHWPAIETASHDGCDVLLTGQGGDQIVGFGYEYLDECYEARAWDSLKTAMRQVTQCRNEDLAYRFPNWDAKSAEAKTQLYAARFFIRKLKHTKQPRLRLHHLAVLITRFGLPLTGLGEILSRKVLKRLQPRDSAPAPGNLIRNDFVSAHTGHADVQRLDATSLVNGDLSPSQAEHLQICFSNQAVSIMEEWSQVLSAKSLKAGHPFLDPDVLELTLATPTKLRFAEGLGRGVLRRALSDFLPSEVLQRSSKSEFSAYGHKGLKTLLTGFHQRAPENHRIWRVVNRQVFDAIVDLVLSDGYTPRLAYAYVWSLLRVVNLAMWFDYFDSIKLVALQDEGHFVMG